MSSASHGVFLESLIIVFNILVRSISFHSLGTLILSFSNNDCAYFRRSVISCFSNKSTNQPRGLLHVFLCLGVDDDNDDEDDGVDVDEDDGAGIGSVDSSFNIFLFFNTGNVTPFGKSLGASLS